MSALRLIVHCPDGVLLDAPVHAVRAEDRDGWFGILPGRRDLVATLPPGLVVLRDEAGEGYVAVSGGLLALRDGTCRVLVREARVARDVDEAARALAELRAAKRTRSARMRAIVERLEIEALRRMARALPGGPR
ncbi:MAG: F0F1 ATP synthase subunit epsilon [Sandaracinaceae bacterium]